MPRKKPPTESSAPIGSITQASDERTRAMEKLLGPPAKSEAKKERASTGCDCSVCRPPEKVRRYLAKILERDFNGHEDRENLKAARMLIRNAFRPLH